jgi:hypothetical protein
MVARRTLTVWDGKYLIENRLLGWIELEVEPFQKFREAASAFVGPALDFLKDARQSEVLEVQPQ